MSRYRKKPVVVEAVHMTSLAEVEACARFCGGKLAWIDPHGIFTCAVGDANAVTIQTHEGVVVAQVGDWIIKGIIGEFYPCDPVVFEGTYEAVELGDGDG